MVNINKLYNAESLVELAESTLGKKPPLEQEKVTMLRKDVTSALSELGLEIGEHVSDNEFGALSRTLIECLKAEALKVRLESFDINKLLSKAAVYQVENPFMRLGQTLINCTPNDIVALMPKGRSQTIFYTHDETKATQLLADTLNLEKEIV